MKTLQNLREANQEQKLATPVIDPNASLDAADEVGNVLLALNHLASITDDLYSAIGDGSISITPDEIDSVLSAYDLLSEMHLKYEDDFAMPSQDYDLDAFDVEVQEEIKLQLEEIALAEEELNQIDEEMSEEDIVKKLTALGFKKMDVEGKRPFMVPVAKKITHLFGIPMRAGKWADIFFFIYAEGENGNKPYAVVDSADGGRTEYTDPARAISDIKKIGVKKEEVELDEGRSFDTFSDKNLIKWLEDNWSGEKVSPIFGQQLKKAAAEAKKRKLKWKMTESFKLDEDVNLSETPGGPSVLQKLKASLAGFQKKLDSGKFPKSESDFKKIIARLEDQIKKHSVKSEDLSENAKNSVLTWNIAKGHEDPFRLEVIGQDGSVVAKILDKVLPASKGAPREDQLAFKSVKERDAAAAALVKYFKTIKEETVDEITLGDISESFDESKFRRLAVTGLVPETDVAQIIRAMKNLDAGKPLTVTQKNLIANTFQALISLVTGDTSVFAKISGAVKKDSTNAK